MKKYWEQIKSLFTYNMTAVLILMALTAVLAVAIF